MKHNAKKTLALLLALVMVLSLVPAMGIAAYADDTSYTLTIPSTLNVANSGWNATDGISATGTLAEGKKLTVTAASDDEFALVFGENKVNYKLAESGDTNTTYANATEKTAWEYTSLSSDATTQPMGVVVEDYSSKPAGTYQDTVTFTASVVSASTPLDNTTTAWTAGTFAVPAGGLTYGDAITVSGDVTLVLTDGETLTLNKGIGLASGATLTVEGNGTMNVNGTNESTASTVAGSGTIILTSGTLTAKGGNGAGISGWVHDQTKSAGGVAINGAVTVSGGTLTATGGNGGSIDSNGNANYAGVGGAAISGSVTVNGGTVTATGGNGGNLKVTISGGTDDERAGNGGAAIGGDATITSGTWTATNGSNGTYNVTSGCYGCSAGTGGKAVAGTVTDNR